MCCRARSGLWQRLHSFTLGGLAVTGCHCRKSGVLEVHETALYLPLGHTMLGKRRHHCRQVSNLHALSSGGH